MADDVVSCGSCGAKNRLGSAPPGQLPRCGRCKEPLPWLAEADDASFHRELAAPVPVLVDFWAPWCGPCRTVAPVLAEMAREHAGRLKVLKVNVDESPQTSGSFDVRSIPTLILFREGRPVETMIGAQPKRALASRLAPHLAA